MVAAINDGIAAAVNQSSKPRFRGVVVKLGGQKYILPSLSWEQFEEHYDALVAPVTGEGAAVVREQLRTYGPIIGDALRRNYPGVTDEQLRGYIDLSNIADLIMAVQGVSGMETVEPGEE